MPTSHDLAPEVALPGTRQRRGDRVPSSLATKHRQCILNSHYYQDRERVHSTALTKPVLHVTASMCISRRKRTWSTNILQQRNLHMRKGLLPSIYS